MLADELNEVELDRDLVLTGGDHDFAALDYRLVVDFQLVIERAAGRLDEADAHARFGDEFLRRLGDKRFLFQEIDGLVDRVEDFDRLGEIVVEDIVGREKFQRVFGIVFGARVKTGTIDIEARD